MRKRKRGSPSTISLHDLRKRSLRLIGSSASSSSSSGDLVNIEPPPPRITTVAVYRGDMSYAAAVASASLGSSSPSSSPSSSLIITSDQKMTSHAIHDCLPRIADQDIYWRVLTQFRGHNIQYIERISSDPWQTESWTSQDSIPLYDRATKALYENREKREKESEADKQSRERLWLRLAMRMDARNLMLERLLPQGIGLSDVHSLQNWLVNWQQVYMRWDSAPSMIGTTSVAREILTAHLVPMLRAFCVAWCRCHARDEYVDLPVGQQTVRWMMEAVSSSSFMLKPDEIIGWMSLIKDWCTLLEGKLLSQLSTDNPFWSMISQEAAQQVLSLRSLTIPVSQLFDCYQRQDAARYRLFLPYVYWGGTPYLHGESLTKLLSRTTSPDSMSKNHNGLIADGVRTLFQSCVRTELVLFDSYHTRLNELTLLEMLLCPKVYHRAWMILIEGLQEPNVSFSCSRPAYLQQLTSIYQQCVQTYIEQPLSQLSCVALPIPLVLLIREFLLPLPHTVFPVVISAASS